MRTRASAVIFASALLATASQASCLRYERPVSLQGTVERRTYPGPPNYESIESGDAAETYWFLQLPEPICLADSHDNEGLEPPEAGVSEVQLVFMSDEAYLLYRRLVGTQVEASGALFHAISGHHHTAVLLRVQELRAGQ